MAELTDSLDLRSLLHRESERVEWKESVADTDDVLRTLSAMANDWSNLGGGYVVCGAVESRDEYGFKQAKLAGLSAAQIKRLLGEVMSGCKDRIDPPINPIAQELAAEDVERRVLIFMIAATGAAHTFRDRKENVTRCYIRMDSETREARNGLFRELMVRKNVLEAWYLRPHHDATIADIDRVALRDVLTRLGYVEPAEDVDRFLSATEQLSALVSPLCKLDALTQTLRPRNFALLLFGRAVQQRCPGAYTILSAYDGVDRGADASARYELDGTIISQAERALSLLQIHNPMFTDMNMEPQNIQKYPESALKEALVNMLVHRDYVSDQPSRITIFEDRVELYSPGALPSAVDKGRLSSGDAAPFWRNQGLAWFFVRLGLAQSEGRGVLKMFRAMKAHGSAAPVYDFGAESVTCTLYAHPRAAARARPRAGGG